MRLNLKLKQIVLAGLLAGLGASAFAANYFFVQPKANTMSKVAPFNVTLNAYSLPVGVIGASYNAGAGFDLKSLLTVSGDPVYDSALVSFTLTSGVLPAGMVLSATGLLSGTPTAADAGSPIKVTATYKTAAGTQTYTVTASLLVSLAGATLPEAVVGLAYNGGTGFDFKPKLSVLGDASFNANLATFAVTTGTLPAGLVLSAAGVLSGTPTSVAAGAPVQVTATYKNTLGVQTYQVISLNIGVTLAAATLPVATQNTVYNTSGYDFKSQLSVTGDANFNSNQAAFTLASGVLPTGLTLNSAGVLSGTPTATTIGTNFTVQASYKLKTGQRTYTIVVGGVPLQVTSISAGSTHTCAITTSGAAKCWGSNANSQLGDGTTTDSSVPVQVSGLASGVSSIKAGNYHTCAITTSGAAKCWGYNGDSQLGDGTSTDSSIPVQVSNLTSGVSSISTGGSHTCAITTGGAVQCWGSNSSGELGNGTSTASTIPVQVSGLTSSVSSISTGGGHTCAITTGGAAQCWGWNGSGQLGNVTTTSSDIPVQVSGLASGVTSISTGLVHTCAVTTGGAAKCWGFNSNGRLGNGTSTASTIPVQVSNLTSGVSSIDASGSHTCAVTTGGAAKCWGYNGYGALGNSTLTDSTIPVQVSNLTSGVSSISTGSGGQTCVITSGGAAKCWGYNGSGQLGNGTKTNSSIPALVLQ